MKTSTRKNTSPPQKMANPWQMIFQVNLLWAFLLENLPCFFSWLPQRKRRNSPEIIMSFTSLIYDIYCCQKIPRKQILEHQLFRQREIVKPLSGEIPSNWFQALAIFSWAKLRILLPPLLDFFYTTFRDLPWEEFFWIFPGPFPCGKI